MKRGYIALSSVLIIAFLVLTIGISVSYLAIGETQVSLGQLRKEEVTDFVESCVEDALLRLNENNAIPTTISLPQGTCIITINSHLGNNWTFTSVGTLQNHKKTILVQATRAVYITVSDWREIE